MMDEGMIEAEWIVMTKQGGGSTRNIGDIFGASPLQGDVPYLIIFSEYENTDESCDYGSLQGRIARISRGY